jgi:phenylpropionate dioxygenase-like ring-hydroxylating dioxygenase large terminal subunit
MAVDPPIVPSDVEVDAALRRQWFPIARTSDLDAGPRGAMLFGVPLVVFRGQDGLIGVLDDACPHRGAALSMGRVAGDSVECPYHGWQWRGVDGRCTHIPSLDEDQRIPPRAVTTAYPATEYLGLVWTALDSPAGDTWLPPELDRPDLVLGAGAPLRTTAGMRTTVENFRDVAHFPFVHQATMGELPKVIPPLDVRRKDTDLFMHVTYRRKQGGSPEVWHDMELSYHVSMPGRSTILLKMEAGTRYVVHVPSPVDDTHTDIYWLAGFQQGYTLFSLDEVLAYESTIVAEDLPVIGAIVPRNPPLEPGAGVSVPADRFTLEYRRAFVDFVRATNQAPVEEPTPA